MVFTADDTFWTWWLRSRKSVTKDLRCGLDSLVFLVGWHLCKEKSSRTFNTTTYSTGEVLAAIADKANLWILAGFRHLRSLAALVNQSYNVFHVK
jgi:hypothetical protein